MKKNFKYSCAPFYIILAAISAVSAVLFWRYANGNAVTFISDIYIHNDIANFFRNFDFDGLSKYGYSHIVFYPLYHVTVALLSFITSSVESASVVVLTACNALTAFLVRKIALIYISPKTTSKKYLLDYFAVFCIIIIGICGPLTFYSPYMKQGAVNMWHNPTYIFMRPFAVLAFSYFIKSLTSLKSGKKKDAVLFGISLFVSTISKPSFALFFLLAAGIISLVEILKNFKTSFFKLGIPLLLAVLPTIIVLLLQKTLVSSGANANTQMLFSLELQDLGIVFSWQNARYIISVLLIVMVFFLSKGFRLVFKDRGYTCALIMMAASGAIWFFTVQGIYLFSDYFWSYAISAFFLTIISAMLSMKSYNAKWATCVFAGIYGFQIYYGIKYIFFLLAGNNFHAGQML
ncbi:MAG: hypothetical protein RR235_02925 [Oscillospiraceae bacterium]